MLTLSFFGDAIAQGVLGFLLSLDGIVYWAVSMLFELFYEIAKMELLTSAAYQDITNKLLVILGVFMLFYLAYALLKALVNPDELTKSTSKIVTNLVVSLVLLNIIPVIFDYAFQLQNIIIEDHVIENIMFKDNSTSIASIGKESAMTTLEGFLDVDPNIGEIEFNGTKYDGWTVPSELKVKCEADPTADGCLYLRDVIVAPGGDFKAISALAESVVEGNTTYTFIISTAAGVFLAYVILSFCLDLGVRVVKLAFYQLISPIPIMMRIIPEKKSVFDSWVKSTMATYFEVFVRLFIIYLISYLTSVILNNINLNGDAGKIAKVIVILGIFAFAKQAPKLISEMLGIKGGDLKLGIKDKLSTGGALTAGAFLGAGATTGIRNFVKGGKNFMSAEGGFNKAKAAAGMFTSTAAGAISGSLRGAKAGWGAKNYADMRKAAGTGAAAAVDARDKRAAYKASHGGTIGAMTGHLTDSLHTAAEWANVELGTEAIKKQLDIYTEGAGFKKKLEDLALKQSTTAKLYEQQINALYQAEISKDKFINDARQSIDKSAIENQVRNNMDLSHFDINRFKEAARNEVKLSDYNNDLQAYTTAVNNLADTKRTAEIEQYVATKTSNEYSAALATADLQAETMYKNAIENRAKEIDQLKRGKQLEVMKYVKENQGKDDFKEIANAFETFKKQNANVEGINKLNLFSSSDIDLSGYDAATITKDDLNQLKKKTAYTSSFEKLNEKKNATARDYAERIQKQQEKNK